MTLWRTQFEPETITRPRFHLAGVWPSHDNILPWGWRSSYSTCLPRIRWFYGVLWLSYSLRVPRTIWSGADNLSCALPNRAPVGVKFIITLSTRKYCYAWLLCDHVAFVARPVASHVDTVFICHTESHDFMYDPRSFQSSYYYYFNYFLYLGWWIMIMGSCYAQAVFC